MKKLLLMWIALLAFGVSFGQSISDYAFSASSGTFTPITGGIAVSTSTSAADFLGDTKTSTAIPIGFTFTYLGVPYTDLVAMSDGYISFNLSATSSLTNNLTSSSSTQRPLLAPLWDDLDGASGTGAANYITEGAAGSRIFTIEWLNWQWNYGATGATISFQIKLYEATGKIEFIYTPAGGTVNNASASIGITGIPTGAGNFLSLNGSGASPAVSSTTETTNISSLPAAGQVYTFTPASCSAPGSLTATNITTTSADLGWTSAATSFQIEYGPAPLTPGTGTRVVTSSNPFSISSLSANTSYSFYIRSICAVGDTSNWAGPMTFTTACDVASIPFFEGFENNNVQDAAIANCWTQEAVSGTDQILANTSITTYNRTPRTGSWNAFLEYSNDRWMFQALSLTAATSYTFEMYVRQDATSGAEVSVFYGTSANAAAMTEMIVDTTVVTNGNYQLITGTFTPSATGTYYLGIEYKLNSSPWYISVDDIMVVESPTCIAPTNLDANDLATDSANLSWTSAATEFQIEYGVSSYTFGTGTRTITSNNPYSLTGLSANTSYDFYVRAICSAGDTSDWTGPMTFTTACDVASIPFFEGFENNNVQDAAIANCWTQEAVSGTDQILANTSITTYNRTPRTGSWNAFLEYSNDRWMFQALSLTAATSYTFEMYVRQDATSGAEVSVFYGTAANAAAMTEMIVDTTLVTNGNYQLITGTFTPATTGTYYLGIESKLTFAPYYISIDDIKVVETPTCIAPTNLDATDLATDSANLSWTSAATEFQIEYGVSSYTFGTGTRTITSNNPYSLTGLSANTSYDFYVRAICSAGDTSDWTGPFTFTTNCAAISAFPWIETFNSTSTTENCWSIIDANADGTLWDMSDNGAPIEGDESAIIYTDYNYGANDDYLITPQLTLTGNQQMKFLYKVESSSEPNDFEVLLSTTGANPADFTHVILDSASYSNEDPEEQIIYLDSYTGNVYIAFHIPENGLDGWVLYIDSVVVENIPSCPEPLSLQVANIASDSADLSWTSSASEFQIEYGVSPLTLGTGTRIITSNNPHSLTGLTASTSYDFYVRAICAAGDTSDWAGPITFTTNCDAVNVPYSENFDGVTTPDIPDCMSVSNDNGDGYSWYTNTTYPNSAPNYMHIRWNTSLAMDDWFYTPGLILTGGTTYQVKFSYRSSSTYDEKFEIKFGQSNSAAGMTGGQIFADSAVITSTYITDSATFIPATSGIYYVGFHGFSDADMNFLAVDDISVTEVVTLNNEAEIITFTIPSQVSSNVNSAAATVDVVMPNGTDVTALIPAITVSTGASIVPNSGVAQNFTNSVVYTVTAEDGITTKDWTVTVTVLSSIENAEYSVSYYPNPATNMLNLDLSELPTGDYRLELLNMQGQKVMDKILVNDGNVISVNLMDIAPGSYVISVSGNNNTFRNYLSIQE